ncbi:4-oxalocrotonate tautomerase [Oceanidesulfovibrio indonesiensis]|uniref:4-oxalocrotonate tautomerase n=2 Tax=Oceanidesulfovibrio indonesiensis TaxID=54767 RepID=A0A7M3M9Q7_9BACT|nr:4-oxalocrotonate tautomerase [Oceanidesulfovibrio indonesiensis]
MPHISVKLFPGRSEETKQRLADAIVKDVVEIIGCAESSVSVSIEDVSSGDWKDEVYDPEIRGKTEYLFKKPGYSM